LAVFIRGLREPTPRLLSDSSFPGQRKSHRSHSRLLGYRRREGAKCQGKAVSGRYARKLLQKTDLRSDTARSALGYRGRILRARSISRNGRFFMTTNSTLFQNVCAATSCGSEPLVRSRCETSLSAARTSAVV